MKIKGVSEAIACYLGWDVADIRENRYHYGRTGTLQIFTVGEDYMTACKTGRKALPKCHDNNYNFKWELLQQDYFGWDIYCYTPTEEG
ncbi:MAG: hypothetical protein KBC72_02885 [Acinetobacter sp.]|nr:hypothetical protein [Acinetobacter sp.]